MSRFSRGSDDVIDLPEMQRRGLIKFPEPEEVIDEIDFTTSPVEEFSNLQSDDNPSPQSDFLSDFASIGASNSSKEPEINSSQSDSEAIKLVNDLKWRLENTEYKMEQLIERLVKLESRFGN